jgi:hypothetical protein
VTVQKANVEEDFLRHLILNIVRMYNKKYRSEFDQMVIACDSSSWRKEYFPEYKFKRKEARKESSFDWDSFFKIINQLINEIKVNFPYKVLKIDGCEADDIISVLAESTQEFGKNEPVMIISSDKDFIQLQRYKNVRQFSPILNKEIKEKDPVRFLKEHILKGDAGDGVPNILSDDNVFVTKTRQTPVLSKKLNEWILNYNDLEKTLDPKIYRNFVRNKKLIDLSEIPSHIKEKIMESYNNQTLSDKGKILNYLITNRCKLLIECISDFT